MAQLLPSSRNNAETSLGGAPPPLYLKPKTLKADTKPRVKSMARDIYIAQSSWITRSSIPVGSLSTTVWDIGYPIISQHPDLTVLDKIWTHQFGGEADHFITHELLTILIIDVDLILEDIRENIETEELNHFLNELRLIVEQAIEEKLALIFIAD